MHLLHKVTHNWLSHYYASFLLRCISKPSRSEGKAKIISQWCNEPLWYLFCFAECWEQWDRTPALAPVEPLTTSLRLGLRRPEQAWRMRLRWSSVGAPASSCWGDQQDVTRQRWVRSHKIAAHLFHKRSVRSILYIPVIVTIETGWLSAFALLHF